MNNAVGLVTLCPAFAFSFFLLAAFFLFPSSSFLWKKFFFLYYSSVEVVAEKKGNRPEAQSFSTPADVSARRCWPPFLTQPSSQAGGCCRKEGDDDDFSNSSICCLHRRKKKHKPLAQKVQVHGTTWQMKRPQGGTKPARGKSNAGLRRVGGRNRATDDDFRVDENFAAAALPLTSGSI